MLVVGDSINIIDELVAVYIPNQSLNEHNYSIGSVNIKYELGYINYKSTYSLKMSIGSITAVHTMQPDYTTTELG